MSAPAPSAPPPMRARWIDWLTVLLLCIGTGAALAGAAPSLARALGPQPLPEAEPPHPHRAAPAAPNGRLPSPSPDDDDPHPTELDRLSPDTPWPSHSRATPHGSASPAPFARPGHARAALTLRESPDPTASETGHVPAGASLSVLGETGEWMLVVLHGPDGSSLFGWTRRVGVTLP